MGHSMEIKNQRGQATTEYLLMLAMVVSVAVMIFKGVLFPRLKEFEARLEKKLESLFSGENLHRLNFKIPKK